MGLKIEAAKLIWILINEDDERGLATIISAMIASLKQTETSIHPLCKGVLENKNAMLNNHTDDINKLYDMLLASFVDNLADLGELLTDKNEENLNDVIQN